MNKPHRRAHIIALGDKLKTGKIKTYAFWIVFTLAVGAFSGWLTREGTEFYNEMITKPPLSPPAWVFPVVWTILYVLMGIGAAKIYMAPRSDARFKSLYFYLVQLAVNFFWSIIFFNLQNYLFALVWLLILWVLIILMILSFSKVSKTAAFLQIPYLIWVTFAAYLNFGVWLLN